LRGDSSDSGRQITNIDTDRTNTVRSPGAGENPDGGGKTIAVLQDGDGNRSAFVSGHGDAAQGDYPADWNTSGGPYGNWCHAEMHALNSLRDGPPGDYELFIDRPPCDRCNGSLARALAELEDQGVNVKVSYLKTTEDEEGNEKTTWKTYEHC
jgi:hypothetical protein